MADWLNAKTRRGEVPRRKPNSSSRYFALFAPSRLVCISLLVVATGCKDDMREQPKYKTYQPSAFFADGRSARPRPEGTVATDEIVVNEHLQRGTRSGKFVNEMPFEMKLADLQRGRERFDIFCAACHGQLGDGNGMIVQRGFQRPPSFHDPAMRDPNQKPLGHYFDAITRGFGGMYSYADRVPVEDRWRIVAYIRALQLSQNADADRASAAPQSPSTVRKAADAVVMKNESTDGGLTDPTKERTEDRR